MIRYLTSSGALPFVYGTLVTSASSADCRSSGTRRGDFSGRISARRLSDNLTFLIDLLAACWKRDWRGLLGVYPCAADAHGDSALVERLSGLYPFVSGPRLRYWAINRRSRACHHDRTVHYFCFPGGLAGRTRRSTRSGSGIWGPRVGKLPGKRLSPTRAPELWVLYFWRSHALSAKPWL